MPLAGEKPIFPAIRLAGIVGAGVVSILCILGIEMCMFI